MRIIVMKSYVLIVMSIAIDWMFATLQYNI